MTDLPNPFNSGVVPSGAPDEAAALTRSHAPGAAAEIQSFDSANSFSVIGSARGTSAMLHPGVVDGSTTQLAGRDSGDRAERRSPNSDEYRFVLDEEKFLFDIGCVPEDFAKYMAMMESLVDHDDPPLFIQEQKRA